LPTRGGRASGDLWLPVIARESPGGKAGWQTDMDYAAATKIETLRNIPSSHTKDRNKAQLAT